MQDVAVVHDLEHHHGVVRGQRRPVDGPRHPGPGREPYGLRVGVQQPHVVAVVRDPDGELRLGADGRDRPPTADREPVGPALRQAGQQRLRGQVLVERGDHERARLVARLVAEPDDTGAVTRRAALEDTDRVSRDLAAPAGTPVPCVELVRASSPSRRSPGDRDRRRPRRERTGWACGSAVPKRAGRTSREGTQPGSPRGGAGVSGRSPPAPRSAGRRRAGDRGPRAGSRPPRRWSPRTPRAARRRRSSPGRRCRPSARGGR